jgi:alkylhydroperoxidase family enzyme
MPRIPPIDNIQFPQEEPAFFANMSTLFRTMAHRPELMQLSMQLLQAAMGTGTVEPALKELLAVRVSQVNHCYY